MSDQIAYVGDTSGDEILDVSFFEQEVDGQPKDFIHIKVPGDKTVEVISEITDNYRRRFARIMGGVQWKNKAQAFLNRGKKTSEDVIAQQQKELDELKQQMAALIAATQGEKRGRKPKESTQTETEAVESGE